MSQTYTVRPSLPAPMALDRFSPFLMPAAAVAASNRFFGERAARQCAWNALDACADGRVGDYRLWLTAFKILHSERQRCGRDSRVPVFRNAIDNAERSMRFE